jgi:hypothetical protein
VSVPSAAQGAAPCSAFEPIGYDSAQPVESIFEQVMPEEHLTVRDQRAEAAVIAVLASGMYHRRV